MHRTVMTWAGCKYNKGWVEISYLGEKNKIKWNKMHLQSLTEEYKLTKKLI